MIEIKNKRDCCGCTACASACPEGCITMARDKEGFLYPFIDRTRCIDCRLCEEKCPVPGREKTAALPGADRAEVNRKAVEAAERLPESYACFLKDDAIRAQSTSGGFFTALAQYVLRQGGIVCGVVLDDSLKAVHTFAEDEAELARMRRSKYVQSDQAGVYQRVEAELRGGRPVLYTGTPCQAAGLKSCLGCEYENLVTADLVCHGVGSPLYWEKYVEYMSRKTGSRIREVRFREKTWGYHSASLAVYFENGKSSRRGHDDDLYWTAFSKNYIYRPSCYACAFKTVNHEADFTVGDFWNTARLPEKFTAADGCSLVLVHSVKAARILERIGDLIETYPVELQKALNINGGHQASMLISCPAVPEQRENWFADMDRMSPQELVDKYLPPGIRGKLKSAARPALYRLGLLNRLKSKQWE